uniref:Catenin (cadherin-associated protein), alpha-like 1 n=1 Tax=Oryzias latipes TaxID=8090 RepID=A0A3B3IJ83_ORYLA
ETMPSCLDQSFIKTAAVEKVVAPISSHLCLLVLLCDSEHEPEQFTRLEAAAHAVARATENMAAVASRYTDDDVLHMEMSALLESVTVSGQHVLLAAQKLHIQPGLTEHREELITATQNVFLGVVLLVEDDAAVRRIIAVADQVLDHLSELGSSPDIKSLFESFQAFSEALILLNRLTLERANSLQDTRQTNQLLDSLDILRRCISMLHTALCTTIKHPTSEEAKASKRYILDKVNSTISEIVVTLRSDKNKGHVGPCGFFTDRRNSLLQLLTNPSTSSIHDSGLDSMVRDVVFHCMAVANASQRESQHRLVSHCRHILQFWSDIKWISTSSEVSEEGFDQLCALMVQQIQMLNSTLMTEVLYQVLDTFLLASSVADELSDATSQVLASDSGTSVDLTCIQPVVEDFITVTDRIIQLVNFISAIAVDVKSLESMENSRMCFTRLRALIASLSLELDDDSMQTVQKLYDAYKKWEEETSELQDALSDVVDVKEFTSLAINEMINDRHGCDTAYREQSYKLFDKYAKHLVSHMKLVIPSVKRHLDRSDNPIYRNGLLVLLKQVRDSQTRVMESIKDMLLGSTINVERYSAFTNNVSTVIQQFKVLREGLDGNQHPHLLSPLREAAREPDICQSSLPVQDTCKINLELKSLPVVEVKGKDSHTKNVEPIEAELAHKHDSNDLKMAAVPDEHKLIHKPPGFDLLPLLFEVVTVTKGKDVSVLNQTCTRVLELSNCYAQAAKEASAIVDLVDCQTLESFRAELVSLTPLLVQTAQETAMSSAKSTEGIYKHCTQFSDLLNNIRKVLVPVGGAWYHAVYTELRRASGETSVRQRLNEVMALCTEVVQVLISSDINLQTDSQETFSVLQSKLSKAQTNTRSLIESSTTLETQEDQLGGFCILWAISVQIVVNSLDKILGTSTAVTQPSPQKQLSALSENSLRIQEAARLTSLNCRSPYKSKQLTKYQNELRALTEDYLKAAEELDMMPSVTQLAKSVFFHRHLLVRIRALSVQLSKENREFETSLQNTVSLAYVAAKSLRQTDISDIIGRAKLMVETRYICDTLTLDVQIRCWSSKAHYVVEEIRKQDGIHQEAKEYIQAGLQGRTPEDVSGPLAVAPNTIKEVDVHDITQKHNQETTDTVSYKSKFSVTSCYLKLCSPYPSAGWDPKDNRIVQVTRKMADTIYVPVEHSHGFTQFIRVIANHSLDKQCTVELSLIIEQILTITNQLSIISSVNAVTPGCRSSDEILVKNAQNLLQTILRGVHAAETASITGLKQPEPNSDEAEATALCFQWKRNLEIHRAQQNSNQETDDLGLRKTLPRPTAPSLAKLFSEALCC